MSSAVYLSSAEPMVAFAVERRSERADTAYSPRFCEEEPSDAANCDIVRALDKFSIFLV